MVCRQSYEQSNTSCCCHTGEYTTHKLGCCTKLWIDTCKSCYIKPQFCYTRKLRYYVNPNRKWPCKYDQQSYLY